MVYLIRQKVVTKSVNFQNFSLMFLELLMMVNSQYQLNRVCKFRIYIIDNSIIITQGIDIVKSLFITFLFRNFKTLKKSLIRLQKLCKFAFMSVQVVVILAE